MSDVLFVKRGLCSDVAGIARLAQLVGRERAAELLFTGEALDAEEALRLGYVSELVAPEDLDETATDLAGRIAATSPLLGSADQATRLRRIDIVCGTAPLGHRNSHGGMLRIRGPGRRGRLVPGAQASPLHRRLSPARR